MKIRIISVVMCMLLALIVFTACDSPQDIVEQSLSHVENQLLLGTTDDFNIEVKIGFSETPSCVDGKVGALQPFTTISIIPLVLGADMSEVQFRYAGLTGTLSRAPTKYALTAEIASNAIDKSLSIITDGVENTVELTDVTDGFANYTTVLAIAKSSLKDTISTDTIEGVLTRETHIRLIKDDSGKLPFYYYVALLKGVDDYVAVLINPETEQVVARKL